MVSQKNPYMKRKLDLFFSRITNAFAKGISFVLTYCKTAVNAFCSTVECKISCYPSNSVFFLVYSVKPTGIVHTISSIYANQAMSKFRFLGVFGEINLVEEFRKLLNRK